MDEVLDPLGGFSVFFHYIEVPHHPQMIYGVLEFKDEIEKETLEHFIHHSLMKKQNFQRIIKDVNKKAFWGKPEKDIDLKNHLFYHTLPEEDDEDFSNLSDEEIEEINHKKLEKFISSLYNSPLDKSLPMWSCHCIQPCRLRNGVKSVLLFRVHHSIGDGGSMVELLLDLDGNDTSFLRPDVKGYMMKQRAQRKKEARERELARRANMNFFALCLTYLFLPFTFILTFFWNMCKLAFAHLKALGHSCAAVLNDSDSSLKGGYKESDCAPRNITLGKEHKVEDLKFIGKHFNGTVNDIVLTCLAGAVRRYFQHTGEYDKKKFIRSLIPIDLRMVPLPVKLPFVGDGTGVDSGNKSGGVQVILPIHEEKQESRLRVIQDEMNKIKRSPEPWYSYLFQVFLCFVFPRPFVKWIVTTRTHAIFSVFLTNVKGPAKEITFGGHSVANLRVMGLSPASSPTVLGIISYEGKMALTIISQSKKAYLLDKFYLDEVEEFKRKVYKANKK